VRISPSRAIDHIRLVLDKTNTDDNYHDFDAGKAPSKN
jgi:hypothetical protein